ncbi:MAG: hypothetical protein KA257_00545 [Opitutaceae bacterium]|nr:hypothetical protein [Opitutaceae bacterium]MBP9912396.1 hypothetical protein [Opitutaceae bacterium]
MHYAAKLTSPRLPLRKVAATLLARRQFPAWLDAAESGVAYPLAVVMPRVRDSLVLRPVAKRKSRSLPDESRSR